jgi:YVTN family beta-propeller protein
MSFRLSRIAFFSILAVVACLPCVSNTRASSFINWETPTVHPLSLSPDGNWLAACNLPGGRLELFDANGGHLTPADSVPVGLNPVSVRFRTATEAWVLNYISDSISVVDIPTRRIVATVETLDTPADIVFAGEPQRAFVSCAMPNQVQVFDPETRREVTRIPIDGQRPKAMAVSPDGKRVYVAIFESGNGSTMLAATLQRSVPTGRST